MRYTLDALLEQAMRTIEFPELHQAAAVLVAGASRSIELIGDIRYGFGHDGSGPMLDDVLGTADQRLHLRAILGLGPLPPQGRYEHWRRSLSEMYASLGWEARFALRPASIHVLLVDREAALVWRTRSTVTLTREPVDMRALGSSFDEEWPACAPLQPLYSTPDALVQSLLVAGQSRWDELITLLAREPHLMHSMDPHSFEELTAELLSREGLEVTLTPQTRDGGRDILAFADTVVGRHLYYVECKRQSAERPVGVGVVRQLYGVVEADRATAGLLVTTSRFTPDALNFSQSLASRIGLKEYSNLVEWLGRHARGGI